MEDAPALDPFVLLDLPRRPIIDLNLLEKNFRSLAAKYHPDQKTGNTDSFHQLQEAANLLRQPVTRLRFLAGEAISSKVIPAAAEELFSIIATALNHAEEASTSYHAASGTLAKALLMKKMAALRLELNAAQEALDKWHGSLDQELHSIDLRWPNVNVEELLSLATNLTFFTRWNDQLKEALVHYKITTELQ